MRRPLDSEEEAFLIARSPLPSPEVLEEYAGKWVVCTCDEVLASTDTIEELPDPLPDGALWFVHQPGQRFI